MPPLFPVTVSPLEGGMLRFEGEGPQFMGVGPRGPTASNVLHDELLAADPRYAGITVESGPTGRFRVGGVPEALRADFLNRIGGVAYDPALTRGYMPGLGSYAGQTFRGFRTPSGTFLAATGLSGGYPVAYTDFPTDEAGWRRALRYFYGTYDPNLPLMYSYAPPPPPPAPEEEEPVRTRSSQPTPPGSSTPSAPTGLIGGLGGGVDTGSGAGYAGYSPEPAAQPLGGMPGLDTGAGEGRSDVGGAPDTGGPSGAAGASAFAQGGIVTQPTVAMLGERGPEAVIPLNTPQRRAVAPRLLGARPLPHDGIW